MARRRRVTAGRQVSPDDLPPDHYRIPCTYGSIPPYEELKGKLFDHVDALFDGSYIWTHGYSTKSRDVLLNVDRTPRERVMLVKHFGYGALTDDVIEWAEQNGYDVAIEPEVRDFAASQPDLQLQFCIVGLGSYAIYNAFSGIGPPDDDRRADRWVPMLFGFADKTRWLVRALFLFRFPHDRWSAYARFLLVRKERLKPTM